MHQAFQNTPLDKIDLSNFNSLINRPPTHTIANLKMGDKNIELKATVLKFNHSAITKNKNQLFQFQIADESGSMHFNCYDQRGEAVQLGDILYINGAYATIYNEKLILYEGKQGILLKIGEFSSKFSEYPNISLAPQESTDKNQKK